MAFTVIGAVAGLVLLAFAADHLVLGAARVAARLRVASIVVGVVVIGLGTSTPEFLVSGLAAAQGHTGVAVGNLIGSNILNLTLILGVTTLIRPIAVTSSVLRREAPLMLAGMALFAVIVTIGLAPLTGALLAAATIAALTWLIRLARVTPERVLAPQVADYTRDEPPRHRLGWEVTRTIAGLAGVLAGAQLLVVGATRIAATLGVPQVVIGFTLVALGTSLPELVTGIQAQRHGETDLLIGNLLGSNLFNSLAGGAIVGLATNQPISAAWPLPAAMLLVGLLAWALLFRGHRLTRPEGLLLLTAYAATLPLLQ